MSGLEVLTKYPILSVDLERLLKSLACPLEVVEIFDRALWCSLVGIPLFKELTVYEAFMLDSWMSSVDPPDEFNPHLLKVISEEIGANFRTSKK